MKLLKSLARNILPLALIIGALLSGRRVVRALCVVALLAFWVAVYIRYRRQGARWTAVDYERFRSITWEAYCRHYNERVPTVEQELELWGPYHEHRHRMRYDLVADRVRELLRPGATVLDVGCGSAMVADRLTDQRAQYVGIDFGAPHVRYAADKFAAYAGALEIVFARGDAAALPFRDSSFDIVVMTEVIEHLIRPELAVWEVARVLSPGGVFVMTTNNASEIPLRSPLSHGLAWLEKAAGATYPSLIAWRPWVWPERVDGSLLPDIDGDVYVPHTHHIFGETRRMMAAAGLTTVSWLTFEFPPPQSKTGRRLARMGVFGRRVADVLESVSRSLPIVRRLGTHLLVVAQKTSEPAAPYPPSGIWPGPFSASNSFIPEGLMVRPNPLSEGAGRITD